MELISGKVASEAIKRGISEEIEAMVAGGRKRPYLVAVLVGNDGASMTYVGHKERTCKELGMDSRVIHLDESVTENELLKVIDELNNDDSVDGFIVQLPLPRHINEDTIINAIDPVKDVDGFHPVNVGRMVLGMKNAHVSATPLGITELIKFYNIETSGKNCVVLGRSNIVGRPVSNLLSAKGYPGNCTVTMCHSRTKNIAEITRRADILIVAIGQREFVTADMVREGAVVIDVGIHRVPDAGKKNGYRLVGDVKYDEVAPKCSMITPVPGGVGPMTIVSLMLNTLRACKMRQEQN